MKKSINEEVKRLQKIAGILNENDYFDRRKSDDASYHGKPSMSSQIPVERDQEVKVISGEYAGNKAIVLDFDSEKDEASGNDWVSIQLMTDRRPKVTVDAKQLKPINDNEDQ